MGGQSNATTTTARRGKAGVGNRQSPMRCSRVRQAIKRATFPWINRCIINTADTGDVEALLEFIGTYVHEMNVVNLSTALHRLAKLCSGSPDTLALVQAHPALAELLPAMDAALIRAETGSADPRCQAASNSIWSLATMQVSYRPLMQTVAALSERRLRDFKPFELSTVLWSFAKLAAIDETAIECSRTLFEVSAPYLLENAEQFSFRCLVMVTWAFATARQLCGDLAQGVAEKLVAMVHMANSQELSNLAWSFSAAGFYHEELFGEFAHKALSKLGDIKPQELSNLLWSFGIAGHCHAPLLEASAHTASSLDLQPQQMSNILWAYSRLQPFHQTTRWLFLSLLPRCTQMVNASQPEDVALLLHAAAKCFGLPTSGRREAATVPVVLLPVEVSDFFSAGLQFAMTRLPEFSTTSLADLAAAIMAMQANFESQLPLNLAKQLKVLQALLRNLVAVPPGVTVNGFTSSFQNAELGFAKAVASEDGQLTASADSAAEPCENSDASWSDGNIEGGQKVMFEEFQGPQLKVVVRNTFLEVEEEPAPETETKDEYAPDLPQLPPPLPIMPDEVCLDKLAAYREDYRRFRVGNPNGARGEPGVSTVDSAES